MCSECAVWDFVERLIKRDAGQFSGTTLQFRLLVDEQIECDVSS